MISEAQHIFMYPLAICISSFEKCLFKSFVVQLLFHVWLLWPQDCSTPGFPVLLYLSEFAQTHVLWVGDAIQPSHPLSSPTSPAFNLSHHSQGFFQWISSSHHMAKYWSFSFSISPSSEYSGPISFRMVWLHLLAVQGMLKSLLQHHSSKALILQCSYFFIVLLSHPYMTTGKNHSLTILKHICTHVQVQTHTCN